MNSNSINPVVLILAICLIAAVGVAIWMYVQKQKTQKLRSRFGPEYEREVGRQHHRGHAETELQKRVERVERFHIHPLKVEDRARYSEEWRRQQARFVDDPRGAVNRADTLVQEVMRLRGYPVADFDQNAADLSVDHPRVVENYRIAHDIAIRESKGSGNTEDLRTAMVSYRTLFDDLLLETAGKPEEVRR